MTKSQPIGERSAFYLLLLALVCTPYYTIAHYLLGEPRLFGKALFLVGLTAAIVGIFLLHARYIIRRLGGVMLLLFWLAAATVIAARFLTDRGGADLYAVRFPFLVFVQTCIALPFVQSAPRAATLRRVLVWSCLAQAALGVIHSLFFSNIVTGMTLDNTGQLIYVLDPGQGNYRESGTLINANTYGAFLVLGLVLLFAQTPRLTAGSLMRIALPAGLLWWGIALSGSRYPFACGTIVTAYFLMRSARIQLLAFLLPAAVAVFVSSPVVARMQQRFAETGSGGRVAIAETALDLATRTPSGLLIGIPSGTLQEARTTNDQILSDNSFAESLLTYGLPFTLCLIGYLVLVWGALVKMEGWVLLTAVLVAGEFALTNAIYWDDYILYAGATLLVVDATAAMGRRRRWVVPGRRGTVAWAAWMNPGAAFQHRLSEPG